MQTTVKLINGNFLTNDDLRLKVIDCEKLKSETINANNLDKTCFEIDGKKVSIDRVQSDDKEKTIYIKVENIK